VQARRFAILLGTTLAVLPAAAGATDGYFTLGTGRGFGWRDTTFYKLGYQVDVSRNLVVRAGTAYGKQPIPSSDVLFNILAPAVTQWHFALGATAKTAKNSELSFAIVGVPGVAVTGPNPLEVPGQQRITLDMHQYEFEVGYAGKN
jgi:long-chain fatty acid transport protein